MNRYSGNGLVERIPEPVDSAPVWFESQNAGPGPGGRERPGATGLPGALSGLFSKLGRSAPELEDIMLIAIMYLLYRETGDIEFLLMGGALLIS